MPARHMVAPGAPSAGRTSSGPSDTTDTKPGMTAPHESDNARRGGGVPNEALSEAIIPDRRMQDVG
jgi:hypothetical protein